MYENHIFIFCASSLFKTIVHPSEVRCAEQIVGHLPVALVNTITSPGWDGGQLLDLSETQGVKTPTAKEISSNYIVLKPVARFMPTKACVSGNLFSN